MLGRLWWRVRFVIHYLYVFSLQEAWECSDKWAKPNNEYYPTHQLTPKQRVEDIRKFRANVKEVELEE